MCGGPDRAEGRRREGGVRNGAGRLDRDAPLRAVGERRTERRREKAVRREGLEAHAVHVEAEGERAVHERPLDRLGGDLPVRAHREHLGACVPRERHAPHVPFDPCVGTGTARNVHFGQFAREVRKRHGGAGAQGVHLPHGPAREAQPLRRPHEVELLRDAERLVERATPVEGDHVQRQPRHQDDTPVRTVLERLGGVPRPALRARLPLVGGNALLHGREDLPVERSDGGDGVRAPEDPCRPLLAPNAQLLQAGTLVQVLLAALRDVVAVEFALQRPVPQVWRRADVDGVGPVLHAVREADPLFPLRVPNHFGIGARHGARKRVPGPVGIVPPVRRRPGAEAGTVFHEDDVRVLPEARRVLPVHHARAADDVPMGRLRDEFRAVVRPVDEIRRFGIAPVQVAPPHAERIVLVEEEPLAVAVDEAVRVVEPALARRELELRTVRLVVEVRRLARTVRRLNRGERVVGKPRDVHLEGECLALVGGDVHPRPPVGILLRQEDVHHADRRAVREDREASPQAAGSAVPHREEDVGLRGDERARMGGDGRGGRRLVERDRVDVDVPPALPCRVDDAQARRAAPERAHVERGGVESLADAGAVGRLVPARLRTDDLAVHEKLQLGAAGGATAADEEVDVGLRDREGGGGERTRGAVPAVVGGDERTPPEAADPRLARQGIRDGALPERRPRHRPRPPVRTLEVVEDDGRGRLHRARRPDRAEARRPERCLRHARARRDGKRPARRLGPRLRHGGHAQAVRREDLQPHAVEEGLEGEPSPVERPVERPSRDRERPLRRVVDKRHAAQVEREASVGRDRAGDVDLRKLPVEEGERHGLPVAQGDEFARRPAHEAQALRRPPQGQLLRQTEGVREVHAGPLRQMVPRHPDGASVRRVRERLRRIVGHAPFPGGNDARKARRLGAEHRPVERPDGVGVVRAPEDPGRPVLALDLQLLQTRALVEPPVLLRRLAPRHGRALRPCLQVGRGEDPDDVPPVLLPVERHHPRARRRMPKHLRVAIPGRQLRDDGVARVLLVPPPVARKREALRERLPLLPGGGVEEDVRVLPEARRVLPVHHARAAEHHPHRVRREDGLPLLPVDEVRRDSVAPVHVPPLRSRGVVLVEEAPFAVLPRQTVRIVDPSETRRVPQLRTVRVARKVRRLRVGVLPGSPADERTPPRDLRVEQRRVGLRVVPHGDAHRVVPVQPPDLPNGEVPAAVRYFLAVDRVDRPLLRGQAHQDLPQRLAPGRHAVRTTVRELGAPFSGVDAQLQTRPLFRDERVRKRRPRRDLKGPHVAGRRRLGQPLRPEPPVRLGDEFAQTEPAAPAVDVVDPPRENPPVAMPGRDHRYGQPLVEVVAALLPGLPRAGLPGRGVIHHEKALDDVGMPLPREDARAVPARVLRVVGDRPSPEAVAPPEAHVVGEAERAVRAVVDGGVLRGGEEDARLLEAQTVRRRGVGAALRHGGREVGHAENPFRTAVRGAPRSHRGPRRLRPRHGPHGVEAVGEMVLPLPAERRPRAVRLPRRGERERGMLEPLRQVRGGEVREVMRPPPRTRLVVAAVVEVEDVEAPTVEPTDDIPHPGIMVVRRPVLD